MPKRGTPSARRRANDPRARSRTGESAAPRSEPAVPKEQASAPEPLPDVESLMRGPVSGVVKIIFTDVDGTLTDGMITYDARGDSRNFFIRDGLGLKWARDNGVLPVALSGRDSPAVQLRMTELGIEYHGGLDDKVAVAQKILEREKVDWRECVMIGDDLPDFAMMRRVGWPIAVADAVREVKMVAKTVTGMPGGKGAVREVVEMVLRHNGAWERVLEWYEAR